MSKKVCPDCGCAEFKVNAIEYHDWIVDGDGVFIEDDGCYDAERASCTEWKCTGCDAVFNSNADLADPDDKEDDDLDPPCARVTWEE